MTATIRDARDEDLPKIIAMLADDPLGAERENPKDPPAVTYLVAFGDILADPRNTQTVAELNGEVVGTLQITFIPSISRRGGERGQVEGVRVAREHRGKGIGKILLEDAIERCKERGCVLVQLTTDKSREDALPFYEGLGFTASHEGMKLSIA